ncbi:hypothetical protein V6Z11_A11G048500 [Gossypium hirsutum]
MKLVNTLPTGLLTTLKALHSVYGGVLPLKT